MCSLLIRFSFLPLFFGSGCVVLLGFFCLPSIEAQVTSDLVGFNKVACPEGEDTVITVPFIRKPVFSGVVGVLSSKSARNVTLSPAGGGGMAANAFTVSPHYLRFRDGGSLAGAWFPIESNTTGGIVVRHNGLDFSAVQSGDPFDVVPHWTLGTIWPKGTQTAIHQSSGKLPPSRSTVVLLADVTSAGIRLAPNKIFFLTAEGWFQSKSLFPASDDVVVPPGQVLIVRHPANSGSTEFISMNHVHSVAHQSSLRTNADAPQDNFVGLMRPIPVALSALDLDSEAFVDSISNDPGDRNDELLVYDSYSGTSNREPDRSYLRVGGEWRLNDGSTYPASDDVLIPPSAGIVIRKATTAAGESVIWSNLPRY